jgi:hypothetical protein
VYVFFCGASRGSRRSPSSPTNLPCYRDRLLLRYSAVSRVPKLEAGATDRGDSSVLGHATGVGDDSDVVAVRVRANVDLRIGGRCAGGFMDVGASSSRVGRMEIRGAGRRAHVCRYETGTALRAGLAGRDGLRRGLRVRGVREPVHGAIPGVDRPHWGQSSWA